MSTTQIRQQLAQRIQELLLRHLGHAIEVQRLIDDARYARDVLLVCDGLPDPEMRALAQHFRHPDQAPAELLLPPPPGHVLQVPEWGADTSGFGVSQPPSLPGQPAAPPPAPVFERRRAWLGSWRRG